LANIEEGKKHCQFPEEMMKSIWIFNRIKSSQMKKSAKNTPTQIKNDLCVKSDDGKTQTSPDATGNASNFETFENPMSPQSAAMISNRHQDLYPKRKTILSHRSESMNMNHEIEQA
jgi:hypothetical protein